MPSTSDGGRRLGHDDGVQRSELAVERDGGRPGDGEVEERAAAAGRSGEADGGDERMPHERDALVDPLDEHDRVRGRAGADERVARDLGDPPRQRRMPRVRLHDDGASRGQRRGGVVAEHREREREVATRRTPRRARSAGASGAGRGGAARATRRASRASPRGTTPSSMTPAKKCSWVAVRTISPPRRASDRWVSAWARATSSSRCASIASASARSQPARSARVVRSTPAAAAARTAESTAIAASVAPSRTPA